MDAHITQDRTLFLRYYRVTCSVSFTEVEHAVIVTQRMHKRQVLDWWRWNGKEKVHEPILVKHILKPFSRKFKTQGEANHFEEQISTALKQLAEYIRYSSKPLPDRKVRL